jgi:hypothetical protein
MIDLLGELKRIQSMNNAETYDRSTDSLEALSLLLSSIQGLYYYGIVTAVPGANQFTIAAHIGAGVGRYAGATAPFRAFVLRDAAGLSAAPQGEMQTITVFDSATGTYTTAAFTAAVAVNDEIIVLHPRLAEIFDILTNLGPMTAVATLDDLSDVLTTSAMAKIRLILNRMSPDAFSAVVQGVARTELDTMLAQLATYIAAAGAAYNSTVNPGGAARTNLEQVLEDFADMLAGATGIVTFPAGAAPANGVSLAEVARYTAEAVNMLTEAPIPSIAEVWQSELGMPEAYFEWTHPATGTPWTVQTSGIYREIYVAPALSENARLNGKRLWLIAPDTYGSNMVYRKVFVEYVIRLTSLANFDNTGTIIGLTPIKTDTRASNNVIGFVLLADVLQALTDLAGAETVTACPTVLTNVNKLKIEIYSGHVKFYVNEVQVADHITNLPDLPMYRNIYILNEAGGATGFELMENRIWAETIVR